MIQRSRWDNILRGIGLRKAELGTRHTLYFVTQAFNGSTIAGNLATTAGPNQVVICPTMAASGGGVAPLLNPQGALPTLTNVQRERGILIERAELWLQSYNSQIFDYKRLHLNDQASGIFLGELTVGNASPVSNGAGIYNVPTVDAPRIVLFDDLPNAGSATGTLQVVASIKSQTPSLTYDALVRFTWWDILGVHVDEYVEEDATERRDLPRIHDLITNDERARRPGSPSPIFRGQPQPVDATPEYDFASGARQGHIGLRRVPGVG